MIKNYFKIAWRSLVKNKVFSFINIFGLTIGLTSFLLIALYIFDEFTFDRFHKNADSIYRVIEHKASAEGTDAMLSATGYQVSEKGKTDLSEIKDVARLLTNSRTNVSTLENTNVFYENYIIGNPGVLTVFDFKLLQGDRLNALNAPHSVILTEETARKLFNSTDVLGKLVKISAESVPFKITGVLENFPANSHLSFNLLFSEATMGKEFKEFANTDWNSNAFTTYLLLKKNADPHKLEARINNIAFTNSDHKDAVERSFILQPIKDIHFYSAAIEGDSGKTGDITYMYVFSIVALFVLLIACINYMNLTTARFANRAKEIGVRKVAGASRKMLIGQFLSESFLVTILAFVFALGLVKLLLPWFNAFTEKQLTLGFYTDTRIWMGVIATIILAGLLSGIYPAFFQSGLTPLLLINNKLKQNKRNISLRRSLVVSQFALSIIMIVATIVVYTQMRFLKTKDMGFNKEQLLVIDINSGKIRRAGETIKTEMKKLPQVKSVSASSRVPGEWKDIPRVTVKTRNARSGNGAEVYFLGIDQQFLNTYQISLVKGRNFASGSIADSSSVILNETAARQLGIIEPSEQLVDIPLSNLFTVKVIGIVKDFNFQSLREPLAPIMLGFEKNPIQNIDYFTVKVVTTNVDETLKQINAILQSIDQDHLFEYHFLDNQWDLFYREDKIRETIFFIVSFLTILIACLGLFGLATYAAEQRIKEIGIRKVLGASVTNIVSMLSKDFLKLVIISTLFAFPIAWWAMNNWLQDFAYHINLGWWMFLAAGCLAFLIALFTISFQAIRAAMANPVRSLRTE